GGTDISQADYPSTYGPNRIGYVIDKNDVALRWQAMSGVSFALSDRLDIDLTYRYAQISRIVMQAHNREYNANGTLSARPPVTRVFGNSSVGPGNFQGSRNDESLTVGVRYAFGAPPP